MFSWTLWHAYSLFEHRGSAILWYLPKRKLGVSVVLRSQWEKPLKPPLVVKFLCPLTPNATNKSTSHPEDKHIGLIYVFICMCFIVCMCVCVIIRAHAHLFFLCVTPYASWVVPAPGVCGVLHFQSRKELGLLCGSTLAKSAIYCPQRAKRDWQCFPKNLLMSWRETTTTSTLFDCLLPPKSPNQSPYTNTGACFILSLFLCLFSVFSLEIKCK